MLVLSRRKGESIVIQDHIEITVLEVDGDTVKIGIAAPREIEILRKELIVAVKETNRESATQQSDIAILAQKLKKIKKSSEKL
ncbi:carbon storage regulator CsrA [Cohnella sp. GCM10027633]|uniref:carbon storage regulator CsrA n=1 Tax=unclassified Cohnella TaxID=2636738 RepID=UPI0036418E68